MKPDNSTIDLLNKLQSIDCWTTSADLAKLLGVTVRRVRYLVKLTNSQYPGLIESSSSGYRLSDRKSSYLPEINQEDKKTYTGNKDRQQYLLEQLVIENKVLDIDQTVDTLCISPATLNNELVELRNILQDHNLTLKTKQGRIFIVGNESVRRAYVMKLLKSELKYNSFSIKSIQSLFHVANLEQIQKIVIACCDRHEYFLDNYSLLIYVLHLAMQIELNHQQSTANNSQQIISPDDIDPEIMDITQEIMKSLTSAYPSILFTREDLWSASLMMTTRATSLKKVDFKGKSLTPIVGEDTAELVHEIINSLYDTYAIVLNNNDFVIRFALHIKKLLARQKNDKYIENSPFSNFKDDYPFLYVVAVHVAYIIAHRKGFIIPNDEISYIALHIGVMLEEAATYESKLVCVIVSTDYYNIAKSIYKKVEKSFGNELIIKDVLTDIDMEYLSTHSPIDLIISTEDINLPMTVPQIKIGTFLTESEIKMVHTRIAELSESKISNSIFTQVDSFLRHDLLYFHSDFHSQKEAIESMCNDMLEKHYVKDTFKDDIYRHETIAASSYGKIAIAHTLSNDDLFSFISIATNIEPIQWGDNQVSIIFILSLNKNDHKQFQTIFSYFTKLLNNEKAFNALLKITSYDELKNVFRTYL